MRKVIESISALRNVVSLRKEVPQVKMSLSSSRCDTSSEYSFFVHKVT